MGTLPNYFWTWYKFFSGWKMKGFISKSEKRSSASRHFKLETPAPWISCRQSQPQLEATVCVRDVKSRSVTPLSDDPNERQAHWGWKNWLMTNWKRVKNARRGSFHCLGGQLLQVVSHRLYWGNRTLTQIVTHEKRCDFFTWDWF